MASMRYRILTRGIMQRKLFRDRIYMCTIDTRGCVIFTTPPGHSKIIEYSWDYVISQKIGQIRRRILRFSKSADKTSGCFLCSFFEFSRQYEKSAGQVWGDDPPKHNMRHVLHIFIFFKFFFTSKYSSAEYH